MSEMQVAVRPQSNELALGRSSIPTEHEMMVYHTMAEQAITSKMYASNFKDKSGVMMVMLSARELGIPPMQALNGGINLINGKAEISARMMGALIRKAGHKFTAKESTENLCTILGVRGDTGESQLASFTLAEAQKAGLVKPGGGWTKWPKDMCYARALSRLSRQLFQDVIGIGYVEGEIQASEVEVMLPEDIGPEITIDPEEEQKKLTTILEWFDKEDRFMVVEYMDEVMKHFGWTKTQCVDAFLKDEANLRKKFDAWKKKHKIA